jgi:hypothetical protein
MIGFRPGRPAGTRFIDPSKLCPTKSQTQALDHLCESNSQTSFLLRSQPAQHSFEDYATLNDELLNLLRSLDSLREVFNEQMSALDQHLSQLRTTSFPVSAAPQPIRFPSQPTVAPPAPRQSGPAVPKPASMRGQGSTSHKHSNVTHFERSRSISPNPNNVWTRVEPFFEPLPSDAELEVLFAQQELPPDVKLDKIEHWSARFRGPITRANGRAVLPPGPPPPPHALAEYWAKTRTWFAIEPVQKSNSSVISHLLNALVEVDPLPPNEQKTLFLRTHPLLPNLPSDGYLRLSFEVRLDLELESLGLNAPSIAPGAHTTAPLQQEIDALRRKVDDEIMPAIRRDLAELKDGLPGFRLTEERRNQRQKFADEKISDWQLKKRVIK